MSANLRVLCDNASLYLISCLKENGSFMEQISALSFLQRWLRYFGQDQAQVTWPERFRSAIGAFIGLLCTVALGQILGGWVGINEWVMASLGASALLIFVLPSSPMAQPWAVIGGNVVSAIVGISCAHFLPNLIWALPIAASLSILAMFLLRCLHPPAAAVSLIAVLGHVTTYRYALFPVLIDSLALCITAMVYHSVTGKRYPTKPITDTQLNKSELKTQQQLEAALDLLLREYQEVVDIDRAELLKIMKIKSTLKSG